MLSQNLTACLLFLSVWAFGQERIDGRLLYIDHIHFFLGTNERTGDLLVFTQDTFYTFNPGSDSVWRASVYKRNDLDFEIFPEEVRFVPGTEEPLFLRHGGGIVYVFRDASLMRIDSSFQHRNQFGAAYFAYKDKIFNYGGYGFFTHKEYMTEFSLLNPEWYVFTYDEKTRIPKGRSYPVYYFDAYAGKFYMGQGSMNTKPSVYRKENKDHSDVWVLDIATKKWKNLGFVPGAKRFPGTDWLFFAEKYTYFTYPGSERNICRLDFEKNRLDFFDAKENINQVIQYRFRAAYNPRNQHFVIARKQIGESNERLIVEAIPKKNLEYNRVFSRRYYQPWWEILLYAVAVPLVIVLIYQAVQWFKRVLPERPVLVHQNYVLVVEDTGDYLRLVFDGQPIEFEEEHQGLIRLFVRNEGHLLNQALLDYVRNGFESQEVLKKRKNRLIREINDSFKIISRLTHPFIEEMQDNNDRRFKEYRIFPEYFQAMRKEL